MTNARPADIPAGENCMNRIVAGANQTATADTRGSSGDVSSRLSLGVITRSAKAMAALQSNAQIAISSDDTILAPRRAPFA
jgi:hypothetical protein